MTARFVYRTKQQNSFKLWICLFFVHTLANVLKLSQVNIIEIDFLSVFIKAVETEN